MMEDGSDHEDNHEATIRTTPSESTGTGEEDSLGLWGYWSKATTIVTDMVNEHPDEVDFLKNTFESAKEATGHAIQHAKEGVDVIKEAFDPLGEIRSHSQDLKLIVTSLELDKIRAVQNAVARVFPVSDCTVSGAKVSSAIAEQPIGFEAGLQGARNRIKALKSIADGVDVDQALILGIESFLIELGGKWFDMSCVILEDTKTKKCFVSYSQGIEVAAKYVEAAREATPPGYRYESSGYMVTAGEYLSEDLGIATDKWHEALSNGHISRESLIELCVIGLLGEFSFTLQESLDDEEDNRNDNESEPIVNQP